MIDEPARSMAREGNFAAFTTMLPSGQPMTHVMWVDCDGQHLLINTETHRTKYHNVLANPLVTVTIWDRNDPYRYAEVRGRVVETVRGPEARRHIDELSMRYVDHPYPADKIGERVILKIDADRQREKILGGEPPPPEHRRESRPPVGGRASDHRQSEKLGDATVLGAVISFCRSRHAMQLGANGPDVDERLGLAQPPRRRPVGDGLEQPLVLGFDPRR